MLLLLLTAVVALDGWLDRTSPVMTPVERSAYRKLVSEAERQSFQKAFWTDKRIIESAYLERAALVDQTYGSGRAGSGANTDQGRLYLASGVPTVVHRLPSSRVFGVR